MAIKRGYRGGYSAPEGGQKPAAPTTGSGVMPARTGGATAELIEAAADGMQEQWLELTALRLENKRLLEALRSEGSNRYWEGRWRDEAAANDRLQAERKALLEGFAEILDACAGDIPTLSWLALKERCRALLEQPQNAPASPAELVLCNHCGKRHLVPAR